MPYRPAIVASAATRVWNRGCDYGFEPTEEGDRILKAVIQFDGLAQNGGLGHALELADEAEVETALAAFRRFGLADAATAVEAARAVDDEEAREGMSDQYYEAAEGLDAAFVRYYADHADEFAPPTNKA